MTTDSGNESYWHDLIEALQIMATHKDGPFPTHCEHDVMYFAADPEKFTEEQIARLEKLGVNIDGDDGQFYSFMFGSC